MTVLHVVIVLSSLGLLLGWGLALAARRFAVHEDPLVEKVDEVLPKGQCGACGYAGCRNYAEAVVTDTAVPPSLCIPGGEETAAQVAKLTGKSCGEMIKRVSSLTCVCDATKAAQNRYNYRGIESCGAAVLLQGGPSQCLHSCLGLGDCARVCPFGAVTMKDRRPVISEGLCTGCGICVKECPRTSLALVQSGALVHVYCHNPAKGAAKRKICPSACIGCAACLKACPFKAITMKNNLAVVEYSMCPPDCPKPCLAKCPTKAIVSMARQ